MHVSSLESRISIYPARKAQLALLLIKEVTVPTKYSDFANVFSEKSVNVLPERIGANKHVIELKEGKQPSYGLIYSLGLVELKTLKTSIETNLANGFIWVSKSLAGTPILFICKFDGSFLLWVNYRELNNLKIKNWYLLALISKSPDWLGQAKQFTQLDLTSAYYQMRIKKGDKCKTVFQSRYSHFKYQVMLFGLFNAPASFQSYTNKILAKKLNIFVIVYLDDIFIYTKNQAKLTSMPFDGFSKNWRKMAFLPNSKNAVFTTMKSVS